MVIKECSAAGIWNRSIHIKGFLDVSQASLDYSLTLIWCIGYASSVLIHNYALFDGSIIAINQASLAHTLVCVLHKPYVD